MKNLKYTLSALAFAFIANTATAQNKVGIETNDPQSTLDVNGNVRVSNIAPDASTSGAVKNFPTILVEPDGKVVKSNQNKKLINLITLRVDMKGCNDWLDKLDTKIPVDQYNIFISRAYFEGSKFTEKEALGEDGRAYEYGVSLIPDPGFRPKISELRASQPFVRPNNGGSTWTISADYPDGTPKCFSTEGTYYWVIDLIVVGKGFMGEEKRIDIYTKGLPFVVNYDYGYLDFDTNSGHTGKATADPIRSTPGNLVPITLP